MEEFGYNVPFFEYLKYKSINVLKEERKWTKEDNTIITSEKPPFEKTGINISGKIIISEPVFGSTNNEELSSLTKQANYTNITLHTIGEQLDRIEDKIPNKKPPQKSNKIVYENTSKTTKTFSKIPFKMLEYKPTLGPSSEELLEQINRQLRELKGKAKVEKNINVLKEIDQESTDHEKNIKQMKYNRKHFEYKNNTNTVQFFNNNNNNNKGYKFR